MNNKIKNPILAVFITIFIDLLGIGLIIPILAPLILHNTSGLIPSDMTYSTKMVIYGLLISSFPISQFIANPIIGSLSDIFGRRKVMLYSLIGTIVGYCILALGIYLNNLALIFLGRIIPGITSGNITVAYSSLADVSSEKDKAKNFGIVGMAFGLGFIIGPFAGGELSNHNIISWFNNEIPFLTAGLLSIINIIVVWYGFPETLKVTRKRKITLMAGIHNINKAFTYPSLRNMFLVVFIFTFGFAFFTQFFIVLLMGKFNFAQEDIGILFGYLGIWVVFTQGSLIRILSKKLNPEKILLFSFPILFLSLSAMLLPDKSIWLYFIIPFFAMANGLSISSSTAVISNLGGAGIQGEILGINQSMNALAQALPALIGSFIVSENYYFPIMIAMFCSLAAWILYTIFYKSKHKEIFSIEEN